MVLWEAILTFALVSAACSEVQRDCHNRASNPHPSWHAYMMQYTATQLPGSACYASPAGALEASERWIPASQVYIAYASVVLEPGHGNAGPLAVGLAVWALTEAGAPQ